MLTEDSTQNARESVFLGTRTHVCSFHVQTSLMYAKEEKEKKGEKIHKRQAHNYLCCRQEILFIRHQRDKGAYKLRVNMDLAMVGRP